ncbi:MAG: hypothetical protein H6752_20595, partial [Candidatus Omnitrophica bacterium]|nr:hypothetical protein [Candidatus Omnitrophota bacterium]
MNLKSLIAIIALVMVPWSFSASGGVLALSTFQADVTPPIGSPLCYGGRMPAVTVQDPLTARGVVLAPEGDPPIVLCAVDWIGIANEGYTVYRQALADAVGTSIDRVAVHALHQHDAPGCDFTIDSMLSEHEIENSLFNADFAHEAIERTAEAAKESMSTTHMITQIGAGRAKVEKVASNRRLVGPDGKVAHMRFTACPDPELRAWPEGTIDPYVNVVSFWDEDQPVAVLSYYATHPQSYYGQGNISADYVGMARSIRAGAIPGAKIIHFTGAGGNIGAGKYNDGSPENRPVLAGRLADGMKRAWENTEKTPISSEDLDWRTLEVALPLREEINDDNKRQILNNSEADPGNRAGAASDLAFRDRTREGKLTFLSCLALGPIQILHMPGELFVEYQLAAQKMAPESVVCMAAYGDGAPGYIGTAAA